MSLPNFENFRMKSSNMMKESITKKIPPHVEIWCDYFAKGIAVSYKKNPKKAIEDTSAALLTKIGGSNMTSREAMIAFLNNHGVAISDNATDEEMVQAFCEYGQYN